MLCVGGWLEGMAMRFVKRFLATPGRGGFRNSLE